MAEPVLACSLSPNALTNRLGEISELMRHHAYGVEPLRDGVVVRFSKTTSARSAVERLIAAERECCSFLTFDLKEEETALHLTIQAPQTFLATLQHTFGLANAAQSCC